VRNENEKNESEFKCLERTKLNGTVLYVHGGIILLSTHTATSVLSGLVSSLCGAGSCSHRSVLALFLKVLFSLSLRSSTSVGQVNRFSSVDSCQS
jgi:hypothetical protein